MSSALPPLPDLTAAEPRLYARRTRDANEARRLLALETIHDRGPRGGAKRIGGVGLQIARDWVVRWRLDNLAQWIWEELRVAVNLRRVGRELHVLGYRKVSAGPRHHVQAEGAIAAFKANS
jgi:hypothetical protein